MSGITDPLPEPPKRPVTVSKVSGRYHTTEQVATILGVSPGAVRVMHFRGNGPPSIESGRRRLYPTDEFEKWLTRQEKR